MLECLLSCLLSPLTLYLNATLWQMNGVSSLTLVFSLTHHYASIQVVGLHHKHQLTSKGGTAHLFEQCLCDSALLPVSLSLSMAELFLRDCRMLPVTETFHLWPREGSKA